MKLYTSTFLPPSLLDGVSLTVAAVPFFLATSWKLCPKIFICYLEDQPSEWTAAVPPQYRNELVLVTGDLQDTLCTWLIRSTVVCTYITYSEPHQQISLQQFMHAKTRGGCVARPKKRSYPGGRNAPLGSWKSPLVAPSATSAGGLFPLRSACRAPHQIRPIQVKKKKEPKSKLALGLSVGFLKLK